ncbi:hypothetical protein [Deinococcus sonorensis]|uniref:Uncharacterized protein n=2 Tax=Deinococcus sonorensis TaxID=309891 RepID=A0AAU7UBZ2_9DEIO
MSRAFVKEDGGGRWEAPAAARRYRASLKGERSAVHESDDLLDVLRWLAERERGEYELHDWTGALLARA